MKKLSLVAIAAVLATPAFADPIGANVGINTSVSQGVNVGSVTNLGLNNVGVVNQNVAVGGGIDLAAGAFSQATANFNMDTHAFSVGSIVDSGNGGEGGDVNVVAINAAVAVSDTETTQAGLAGGLAIPVALSANGTALQDASATPIVPINVGVGTGDSTTASAARLTTVQANLSSQQSATAASATQDGIGNGIDANGGNGQAFMITIGSNNTSIDNTSVSRIEVDTNINVADRGGVAGGLRVDDSFNPIDIQDNAIALAGVAVTANHNAIGNGAP
ncbi:MAG: hypothetical protein FD139_3235 [Methylocystaceae bacterium]|nr:MAG: hypothetical protein FD148_1507 [Methylocystaceae bacterium]KAF0213254.1 MAG: hypothetical protein FD172_584 [Methylocystaceae bacterium]TXT42970.1 MAG: hypothetical protein FD139_3235 [Methylocystaceae bacterium]